MTKKKIFIITLIILFLLTVVTALLNLSFNPIKNNDINAEIAVDDTLKEKLDEIDVVEEPENKNVLIIGSDKSGELADVIMLAKINIETKEVKIISVPRDTRIKVNNNFVKINNVLGTNGINGVKQAVEYILKTKVDNYILFSTDTFKETIDSLGGVDFNVPQNMNYHDPVQDLHINLKKGFQHLDGEKAEQLVRFRKYPMGDLDRIKVQQDFFKELITQKLNYTLIENADSLISTLIKNVNTDVSLKDTIPYISFLKSIDNIDVSFYTIPGIADYIDEISYFIIDEEEISDFLLYDLYNKENPQEIIFEYSE